MMNAPPPCAHEFPCALRPMTIASFRATVRDNNLHVVTARSTKPGHTDLTYYAVVRKATHALYLRSIWHVVGKDDNAILTPVPESEHFYYPERTPH